MTTRMLCFRIHCSTIWKDEKKRMKNGSAFLLQFFSAMLARFPVGECFLFAVPAGQFGSPVRKRTEKIEKRNTRQQIDSQQNRHHQHGKKKVEDKIDRHRRIVLVGTNLKRYQSVRFSLTVCLHPRQQNSFPVAETDFPDASHRICRLLRLCGSIPIRDSLRLNKFNGIGGIIE